MCRKFFHIIKFFIFFCSFSANSFEKSYEVIDNPDTYYSDIDPIEATKDAISWDVFKKTKELQKHITKEDGEYYLLIPEFSEEMKKLDGKQVILYGFIFPLDASENQGNFLFGPYPITCPFHYHTRPSQVVEVLANPSIKFSYEPIKITGKKL
jgi:hypothetical protein